MVVEETTYYLEMTSPSLLRAALRPAVDVELRRVEVPSPTLNRAMYAAVGSQWWWIDRLGWTEERWLSELMRPGQETWVAYCGGAPSGYFEILPTGEGEVSIEYFGLMPSFVGKGLGGWMLSECVSRAWSLGARKIVVHTSSLDHPAALANYESRGFTLVRRETRPKEMPLRRSNIWGGFEPETTAGPAGVIAAFAESFASNKRLADRAVAQVSDASLNVALDQHTNSIAVIMRHLAGNLRSRWTDFLTTDGEKPWRDRDGEFDPTPRSRSLILEDWESGWRCVLSTVAALTEADLSRTITIRGEPHAVSLALTRSLSHAGYHVGQIVMISRILAGDVWETLTIPRGGFSDYNRQVWARTNAQ